MKAIWLDSYPEGVPKQLDIDPHATLIDEFETAVGEWRERPAFSNLGCSLSYADVDRLSCQFAVTLQQEFGLQTGDHVALMMPNLLQYPIALFGCLRAGLVVVNINPLYKARELRHQLRDSEAKAIVIYAGSAHVLAEVIDETPVQHVMITQAGDLLPTPRRQLINFVVRYIRRGVVAFDIPGAEAFRSILAADTSDYVRPGRLQGSDLAILQYTGGTTGLSKGAMLSHTNIIANVTQVNSWFGGRDMPGEEVIVTPLPLYHVYALTVNCFAYFRKGAHNILITDPRDTSGLVRELGRWPFTVITGVNTLFQSLVRHPRFAQLDFSSLKVVSAGGMALQEATAHKWAHITGVQIVEGYGLSETSPVVSSNPVDVKEFNGCIGLPLPGTEVSIRDDDGREVAPGEAGELCVRGPQVMLGYWKQPQATAEAMTDDGFLRTGDMARMEGNGYLRIVDRKKDIIIVSGFNVYPNEIENIVTGHPDVLEAAIVGVSADDDSEVVKLFVVLREDAELTAKEMRSWCRENMTAYKVPRYVEFVDSLPKSNVGKILRRELREKDAAATE